VIGPGIVKLVDMQPVMGWAREVIAMSGRSLRA